MAEEKNKGGRPTVYSDEKLGAARMYLKNFKGDGEVVPSIEGLASALDISRETVRDWASQEEKAEFSGIVAQILIAQGKMLINKGLDGTFNPTITKLMLSKHGYKESTETEHTGNIPVKVIQYVEPRDKGTDNPI